MFRSHRPTVEQLRDKLRQSEELATPEQTAKEMVQLTTGEVKKLADVAETVKEALPASRKRLKEEKALAKTLKEKSDRVDRRLVRDIGKSDDKTKGLLLSEKRKRASSAPPTGERQRRQPPRIISIGEHNYRQNIRWRT